MTQAILYGSSPHVSIGVVMPFTRLITTQNPLHFSFPPYIEEESLMQAAEQISQAILRSGYIASFSLGFTHWGTRSYTRKGWPRLDCAFSRAQGEIRVAYQIHQ